MRFIITLFIALSVFSTQSIAMEMQTKAKQAYIIDFETKQVLMDKQSDTKMPTSSMSKVMTAIMVFDAIKNGNITMETTFNVSQKASQKGGSKMFIAEGTNVAVSDLLHGIIIQSGNDATIAVAEGLSGSEDNFAEVMTARANEIGMKNSNFVNASGWPDPDHYSTAQDLTIMSEYLIKNYPEYYALYGEKEFEYSGIKQANRNPLLSRNPNADGIKTGHTEIAGYGLIGSAKKDDRRVIMVLNGMESQAERAAESQRLMAWALDSFKNKQIISKGQIVAQADVALGKKEIISLTAAEDVLATIKKSADKKYKINAGFKSPLIAPINQGDVVGAILIEIPDQNDIKIPLIAAENVEQAGFFKRYFSKLKSHLFNIL